MIINHNNNYHSFDTPNNKSIGLLEFCVYFYSLANLFLTHTRKVRITLGRQHIGATPWHWGAVEGAGRAHKHGPLMGIGGGGGQGSPVSWDERKHENLETIAWNGNWGEMEWELGEMEWE